MIGGRQGRRIRSESRTLRRPARGAGRAGPTRARRRWCRGPTGSRSPSTCCGPLGGAYRRSLPPAAPRVWRLKSPLRHRTENDLGCGPRRAGPGALLGSNRALSGSSPTLRSWRRGGLSRVVSNGRLPNTPIRDPIRWPRWSTRHENSLLGVITGYSPSPAGRIQKAHNPKVVGSNLYVRIPIPGGSSVFTLVPSETRRAQTGPRVGGLTQRKSGALFDPPDAVGR